jgi:hypothetical protein
LLIDLKIAGLNVKLSICDNAGENMIKEDDSEIKIFEVTFEFFGIPQRNGKVKISDSLCKNLINAKWSWATRSIERQGFG